MALGPENNPEGYKPFDPLATYKEKANNLNMSMSN